MIRSPTLFIVGAGASTDFNFPIGSKLISQLYNCLKFENDTIGGVVGDQDLWQAIKELSKTDDGNLNDYFTVANELQVLSKGSVSSIDQLVHTHSSKPHLAEIAKLSIAKCILSREKDSALAIEKSNDLKSNPLSKGNWIDTLCTYHFRENVSTSTESLFSNIAFVSFNYDRCIQQCLRRATANYFSLDDTSAIEICDKVQVLHPYGSLGRLPKQSAGGELCYGAKSNPSTLVAMGKQIRTFTEGARDSKFNIAVQTLIDWANVIVFLGFGYQGLNLKLLGNVNKIAQPKILYGTAYKMSKPNAEYAYRTVVDQFHAPNARQFNTDLKADDLLKEYELELFS